MESYTDFAGVYDLLMDETPYEQWCNFIVDILSEDGADCGLILDLGCGTGTLTEMLSDKGYDMIGVDASFEMLEIARENMLESGKDILYLNQEMQSFELYGTVRAVVSTCDCINYITDATQLRECFRLVENYLDPEGLFIFDFNTVHKYRDVIGDSVIAENRENCSFIWENYYDEETGINEYDLTLFIENEELSEKYGGSICEKAVETHYQRGYELEEIKNMLQAAGLAFVAAFDDYTKKAPHENSERIVVVARETHIDGKTYV